MACCVVQCPGCCRIVGHTQTKATAGAAAATLLAVETCQGLELSAQQYRDPKDPAQGPSRRAQCASCKAPIGKVLVDAEVLVVNRGDVGIYEIPHLAGGAGEPDDALPSTAYPRDSPTRKRKRPAASTLSPPAHGRQEAVPAQMPDPIGRAELKALVRREVANARARWAADLATEKSMESLVKELINDDMAKVKFALLALNNRMNKLVDELTFDEPSAPGGSSAPAPASHASGPPSEDGESDAETEHRSVNHAKRPRGSARGDKNVAHRQKRHGQETGKIRNRKSRRDDDSHVSDGAADDDDDAEAADEDDEMDSVIREMEDSDYN